ncbi:MAG TPA: hypothetical protein ENI23_06355 [bacterium]|nr:hypothetical protein [bacterium]
MPIPHPEDIEGRIRFHEEQTAIAFEWHVQNSKGGDPMVPRNLSGIDTLRIPRLVQGGIIDKLEATLIGLIGPPNGFKSGIHRRYSKTHAIPIVHQESTLTAVKLARYGRGRVLDSFFYLVEEGKSSTVRDVLDNLINRYGDPQTTSYDPELLGWMQHNSIQDTLEAVRRVQMEGLTPTAMITDRVSSLDIIVFERALLLAKRFDRENTPTPERLQISQGIDFINTLWENNGWLNILIFSMTPVEESLRRADREGEIVNEEFLTILYKQYLRLIFELRTHPDLPLFFAVINSEQPKEQLYSVAERLINLGLTTSGHNLKLAQSIEREKHKIPFPIRGTTPDFTAQCSTLFHGRKVKREFEELPQQEIELIEKITSVLAYQINLVYRIKKEVPSLDISPIYLEMFEAFRADPNFGHHVLPLEERAIAFLAEKDDLPETDDGKGIYAGTPEGEIQIIFETELFDPALLSEKEKEGLRIAALSLAYTIRGVVLSKEPIERKSVIYERLAQLVTTLIVK